MLLIVPVLRVCAFLRVVLVLVSENHPEENALRGVQAEKKRAQREAELKSNAEIHELSAKEGLTRRVVVTKYSVVRIRRMALLVSLRILVLIPVVGIRLYHFRKFCNFCNVLPAGKHGNRHGDASIEHTRDHWNVLSTTP